MTSTLPRHHEGEWYALAQGRSERMHYSSLATERRCSVVLQMEFRSSVTPPGANVISVTRAPPASMKFGELELCSGATLHRNVSEAPRGLSVYVVKLRECSCPGLCPWLSEGIWELAQSRTVDRVSISKQKESSSPGCRPPTVIFFILSNVTVG